MDGGLHAWLESIEKELYLPFSHDEEEKLHNHISSMMNPDDYFYSLLDDSSPVISNAAAAVPSETSDVGLEKNQIKIVEELSNYRRSDMRTIAAPEVHAAGDRRRRAMQMQTVSRKFESRAALLEDIIKYIQYLQKQLQVMGNDIWYQTPFQCYNIPQVSPCCCCCCCCCCMGLRSALPQAMIHYTPQQMPNIITWTFQCNSFGYI